MIRLRISWIFWRRPGSLRASSSVEKGSGIPPLARTCWTRVGPVSTEAMQDSFELDCPRILFRRDSGVPCVLVRSLAGEQVLVDLAVDTHRESHIARIDGLASVDLSRDLLRRAERDQKLGIDAFVIDRVGRLDRITRFDQHSLDEAVEL